MAFRSINSKLSTSFFLTITSTITLLLFGFLTSILVGKAISISQYGIYNTLINIFLLSATFSIFGTNATVIHYCGNKNINHLRILKNTLLITLPLSLIISFCLFVFPSVVGNIIGLDEPEQLKLVSLIVPLLTFNRTLFNYFRCIGKISTFAIQECLRGIILFVVTLIAINISPTAIYAILAFLITELILALYGLQQLIPLARRTNQLTETINLRSILKFSIHLAITALLVDIELRYGIFLVGKFHDQSQVAYLSLAFLIAQSLLILPSAIEKVVSPTLSQYHHEKNILQFELLINHTVQITLSLLGVVFLIMLYFYNDLLEFIFQEKPGYLDSYLLFLFLGLAFSARGTFASISSVYACIGKPAIYTKTIPIRVIINIIITILLWKSYGTTGIAIGMAISAITITVLLLYLLKRITSISLQSKKIFLIASLIIIETNILYHKITPLFTAMTLVSCCIFLLYISINSFYKKAQ